MNRKLDATIWTLWIAVTPLMFAAIWMVFIYAPEELVMGPPQRIFYFHVPAAIITFASVFLLLGASVAYLWTRDLKWDDLSRASTETAMLFCTLVLTTGPLWAKPAWGVWWTWEAKLTTTLILWVLLAACLMVRNYATHRDQGARLAAVVGIFAAIDIPIIHKATVWWRGQHPVVFAPNKGGSLAPKMAETFQLSMIVFFLLFALIVALRYRMATMEHRTDVAREQLSR
jgi:heme exporter protein C